MDYKQLEARLSSMIARRRIIFLIFLILSIGAIVLCWCLREATKEWMELGDGYFTYSTVVYNDAYLIGVYIGAPTALVSGCLLISDLLGARFVTVESHGSYITVYTGFTGIYLYIDGVENGSILPFGGCSPIIEAKLPTGVGISFVAARSYLTLGVITFSDGTPPVNLSIA